MMGVNFTPEQQKAISLREETLLVSAAAGSGKTAVLTERIVSRVCDDTPPVDIDRLLIVTFTNAAAAEMRERIRLALSKRLEEAPENEHLQKQAALLHNAQITTIDSFCLFLLRNHFNDIGLDPGFRIVDEGERKLMEAEVMEGLLEDYYQAADGAFFYCLESFSTNGSDKPLAEQIQKLSDFALSLPWPEEWLSECMASYVPLDAAGMEESPWGRFVKRDTGLLLAGCLEKLEQGLGLCEEADGPYMYAPLLQQEKEMVEELLADLEASGVNGLQEMYAALQEVSFGRLSSKKDETVSPEKRERAKSLRAEVKAAVGFLKEEYFWQPPETALLDIAGSGRAVKKLLELTLCYQQRLMEKKREKNVIDFSDMEHLALEILTEKTAEGVEPSKAALALQEHFVEVLIDEYQDSNLVQEYLLRSVSREGRGEYNRFLVGDVKQSIYKFRLARPEIFMEKLAAYDRDAGPRRKLELHRNFRSRRQVLDCVNRVFAKIMGPDLGGVEYDEAAALKAGADYPEQEDGAAELWLLARDKESQEGRVEQEARLIARRIETLMQGFLVTDKETGGLRPVRYGDIVILLRTSAGWDEPLKRVLKEHGIPAYVASRTGYFSSEEVRQVMNFLRLVDNPQQDLPLYGVLHSPFAGLSEEEIAGLRAGQPQGGLYDSLRAAVERPEGTAAKEPEAAAKLRQFWERLTAYRQRAVYTPVQRLVREILNETGYLRYARALPAGEQRQANLEMLLQKAADFEKTSYFGLFHFIRYMEQLEKYEVDFGEAGIVDENENIVRIMSIHKSKGLEFPVCIVAGLAKRFNMQDAGKMLLMDMDLGLGCDYVDPERRVRCATVQKKAVARKVRTDNLGEELRILYVAMTRAREKLILTGCVEDIEKAAALSGSVPEGRRLSYLERSGAGSFLDYLLPAWPEGEGMQLSCCTLEELAAEREKETVSQEMRRLRLLHYEAEAYDRQGYEALRERFAYRYPHESLRHLYTKTTVSELKRERMLESAEEAEQLFEAREREVYIPRFRREKEEASGTARGNAYHRVMELLRLGAFTPSDSEAEAEEKLERQLAELTNAGRLSEEYMTCVSEKKLRKFLESALARRMAEAERQSCLYREQPFVLGLPGNQVKPEFPASEMVLMQGIIDAYFEEEDGIVVVDYKTDRVKDGQELVNRYRAQLDYYAQALEKLTDKRVKEKLIYSFRLDAVIPV